MRLRDSAKVWWDEMFKPKVRKTRDVRAYGKNGHGECERRRRQMAAGQLDYGQHYQSAAERAAGARPQTETSR